MLLRISAEGKLVNRFTGTRLEDLQGEILALCKDQHGCRYLQKKLEEGVPEHRDIIFRETFGHFADLMTGIFSLASNLLVTEVPSHRSIWQLSLPEAARVLDRRATNSHLRLCRQRFGHYLPQYAWYPCCSKDGRLSLHSETGEIICRINTMSYTHLRLMLGTMHKSTQSFSPSVCTSLC